MDTINNSEWGTQYLGQDTIRNSEWGIQYLGQDTIRNSEWSTKYLSLDTIRNSEWATLYLGLDMIGNSEQGTQHSEQDTIRINKTHVDIFTFHGQSGTASVMIKDCYNNTERSTDLSSWCNDVKKNYLSPGMTGKSLHVS